jgi:hypothetical protein
MCKKRSQVLSLVISCINPFNTARLGRPLEFFRLAKSLAGFLSSFSLGQHEKATRFVILFDESAAVVANVLNYRTAQVGLQLRSFRVSVHQLHLAHHVSVPLVASMMVAATPAATEHVPFKDFVDEHTAVTTISNGRVSAGSYLGNQRWKSLRGQGGVTRKTRKRPRRFGRVGETNAGGPKQVKSFRCGARRAFRRRHNRDWGKLA